MKGALRSLSKYPARSVFYAALLTIVFTVITLLVNTIFTGMNIIKPFQDFSRSITDYEEMASHADLFEIQNIIQAAMSSLIPIVALTILLCVMVLPFLQYLFSIGRGYEIGVLRALGMSKGKSWRKLFLENTILIVFAIAVTQVIVLLLHEQFALTMLSIDADMTAKMNDAFTEISETLSYHRYSSLFAFGAAAMIILVTAGFCSILISGNAPLKLIREYKKGE